MSEACVSLDQSPGYLKGKGGRNVMSIAKSDYSIVCPLKKSQGEDWRGGGHGCNTKDLQRSTITKN